MEVILKHFDMGIVLSIVGILLTICYGKIKNYSIASISQQINIVKPNILVPYIKDKDNEVFTLTINKEVVKNIALFLAGVICVCLVYKVYKHWSLKSL